MAVLQCVRAIVVSGYVLVMMIAPGVALVDVIHYQWSTYGSGSVGEQQFSSADIRFDLIADEVYSGRWEFGYRNYVFYPWDDGTSATVTIDGIGEIAITQFVGAVHTPSNQDFAVHTGRARLLELANTGIGEDENYQMETAIGPVYGIAYIRSDDYLETEVGNLVLTETAPRGQFVATVPIPAVAWLFWSGLIGGLFSLRRQRR